MTSTGIAWPGDAQKYAKSSYQNSAVVPPPFWMARFPNGYTDQNPIPDLSKDEHFQVWMRTAGLPTFRKLFFRNDGETMAAGRYSIDVFMSESEVSQRVRKDVVDTNSLYPMMFRQTTPSPNSTVRNR